MHAREKFLNKGTYVKVKENSLTVKKKKRKQMGAYSRYRRRYKNAVHKAQYLYSRNL